MSWSTSITGKAPAVAAVVKAQFAAAGGAPAGSAEEAAKNALGAIAESLCNSFAADAANKVVTIIAQGSSWNNPDGTAEAQTCSFSFSTVGNFVG